MSDFLGSFEPFARMIMVFGIMTLLVGYLTHGKPRSVREERTQVVMKVGLSGFFVVVTAIIILLYFLQAIKIFDFQQ